MTTRAKKTVKFVHVQWHDTCSDSRWCAFDGLPKPLIVHSRGWLIEHGRKSVTLSASLIDSDATDMKFGDNICIPKGCIISIKEIKGA